MLKFKGGVMLELKDTVKMMNSEDWKKRLKAEYWQLQIRLSKLEKVIENESEKEDFDLTETAKLLKSQGFFMENYLNILEIRAERAGIDLNKL